MPRLETRLAALLLLLGLAGQAAPVLAQSPAPAPETGVPAVVRIGTQAVLSIREADAGASPAERAQVIQSRLNMVLVHHPYLSPDAIRVDTQGGTPVIQWGRFPIASADAVHARLNRFSSPRALAEAWAANIRAAARRFVTSKHLPERALYRNASGSDFAYRRTERTLDAGTTLENTTYVFAPDDLDWGPGIREAGQDGFAVFVMPGAPMPPDRVYLGNAQGGFTEYEFIPAEEQP